MKKEIILVGGGGHCRACIDVIEAGEEFVVAGIVDLKGKLGSEVSGYRIIATDSELERLAIKFKYFLVTVGYIKDMSKRIQIIKHLKRLNVNLPVIVSPFSYVSRNTLIGEGSIIMHKAVINTNVKVGENSIINTSALLEHDVSIGEHCHISTGAVINGGCQIGKRVFVGSNTVVVNNVGIGDDVIIGAGSVVLRSIIKKGVYGGNPLRELNLRCRESS